MSTARVVHADCVEHMAGMDPCSIDAIVTDPPYGLEFMGKEWDRFGRGEAASHATATRAARGGHSATDGRPTFLGGLNPRCRACGRSQRGGSPCRCETPDFTDERGPRMRAFQAWCETWAAEALRVLKPGGHLAAFGGTRTYHRLTAGIENAGFEIRDCLAWMHGTGFPKSLDVAKAIDKAKGHWRGRRGAVIGRSVAPGGPHYERTDKGEPVTPEAKKWDGWGTALKPAFEPIVLARKPPQGTVTANVVAHGTGALNIDACRIPHKPDQGRWPTNVLLDDAAAGLLDRQIGERFDGGASRFFFTAKAGRAERGPGNTHPTVKPVELMRWLVRLVTPPGGTVLDPFAGSGTTLVACVIEGFDCIGIEREDEYVEIIKARLAQPIEPVLFGGAA